VGVKERRNQTRGRAPGKTKAKTNTKNADKECGAKTKKRPEESAGKRLRPVDFMNLRKDIASRVGSAAKSILAAVIEQAQGGQLGAAKYLFEAVGLYPARAETASGPEDSLAYTLLKRLGLPTDPWIGDEDGSPVGVGGDNKRALLERNLRSEFRIGDAETTNETQQMTRQNEDRRDAVK
jgi:hypothetical protein